MGHLKDTIEEASVSVEKEKAKNVELLSTVFPTQIARELWLGKLYMGHSMPTHSLFSRPISDFDEIWQTC